ncbi:MAG: NAD(P)H-hydrate dehydratase [Cyanobacteriota bacterium]|nr:NAD(P)H-hydrate dehydratase [Cyanobacteriota bacterium]
MNSSSHLLVSASQMQALEQAMFAAGMPVAALMEKASLGVARQIARAFPTARYRQVGCLIGAGHNGGDGLVVGRELALQGRRVRVWMPISQAKPLTIEQARYVQALGSDFVQDPTHLSGCDLLIDAMFGIGLTRPVEDPWRMAIDWANQSGIPILSLDLPSGLHSQTGHPLGSCIRAEVTYCLGLWKVGLWQEAAQPYVGRLERIDIGIPAFALNAVLPDAPPLHLLPSIPPFLPPPPAPTTHKYRQGSLLLIGGSATYGGAAILLGLGSRYSGVGMVTLALPASLHLLGLHWLPEVLIRACGETEQGGIASVGNLSWSDYDAIAIGPGLTAGDAPFWREWLEEASQIPSVVDADALNWLARQPSTLWAQRQAPTILTPHAGEFQRLFPDIPFTDRLQAAQVAAAQSNSIVVLKGSKTVIAAPHGKTWVNPASTTGLARGGSGDVLTGLMAGLLAQHLPAEEVACLAVWWHSQVARRLAEQRSRRGVDPVHLAEAFAQFPLESLADSQPEENPSLPWARFAGGEL